MTLNQAVARGISKVRDPNWASPEDYILIDLIPDPKNPGHFWHGPWLHLYSPLQPILGQPTPQEILFNSLNWDEDGWVAFEPETTVRIL
jgi:hypothetical protein